MDDLFEQLRTAFPDQTDEQIQEQLADLKSQGATDEQLRDDIIPAAIAGAAQRRGTQTGGPATPAPSYDAELEMKKRAAVRAAVERNMSRPAMPEANPFEFAAMGAAAFGDPRSAAAGRPANNFALAGEQVRKRFDDKIAREKSVDDATEKELDRQNRMSIYGVRAQATSIRPEVLEGLILQRRPNMMPEEREALKRMTAKEMMTVLNDLKAKEHADATAGRADRNFEMSVASREDSARGQFQNNQKDFFDIHNSFQRVRDAASDPSAAGDLALIYNYMKMLDPGSVVREAEFAQAAKAGSLPSQIQGAASTVISGQRLAPAIRADFVDRAKKLYTGQRKLYEASIEEAKKVAKEGRLNPERVVVFKPDIAADIQREPDVEAYAQKYGITYEQALAVKRKRMGL